MKYLGVLVLSLLALFAIGSFLAPFLALIYALCTFTLVEIVKGLLILYVASIPVCAFLDAKRRVDQG